MAFAADRAIALLADRCTVGHPNEALFSWVSSNFSCSLNHPVLCVRPYVAWQVIPLRAQAHGAGTAMCGTIGVLYCSKHVSRYRQGKPLGVPRAMFASSHWDSTCASLAVVVHKGRVRCTLLCCINYC
jgi:hypothetical protein